MQQDKFDRQQVTVCDTRSKVHVRISTNVRFNGVKRIRRSTSRTPPGGRSSTFYRGVNMLLFAIHGQKYVFPHKKGSKSYESGYTRSCRSEMAEVRELLSDGEPIRGG